MLPKNRPFNRACVSRAEIINNSYQNDVYSFDHYCSIILPRRPDIRFIILIHTAYMYVCMYACMQQG